MARFEPSRTDSQDWRWRWQCPHFFTTMKFSIRDLLLVTVIVALAVGSWMDRSRRLFMKTCHVVAISLSVGFLSASPCFHTFAAARPTKDWTFSLLRDEADVICIGILKATNKTDNKEFLPSHLDRFESDVKVLAVMKGDKDLADLVFVHFRYKRDIRTTLGNGPTFPVLNDDRDPKLVKEDKPSGTPSRKADEYETFMFFLKRRPDGKFGPASGDDDAVHSVARVTGYTWDDLRKNPDKR